MVKDGKIKFSKPKILLVDMPEDAYATLMEKGYNVQQGTLGIPYNVGKSSNILPVGYCGKLPNFAEQEIIICDFYIDQHKFLNEQPLDNIKPADEEQFWVKCSSGFIDPRPLTCACIVEAFDNILRNSGIFIIFADEPTKMPYMKGYIDKANRHFRVNEFIGSTIKIDIWSFLSCLQYVQRDYSSGNEILFCESFKSVRSTLSKSLQKLLKTHLDDAEYHCSFTIDSSQWLPILENKYGQYVSMMARPDNYKGLIFVFPQLRDKAEFIASMLAEFLPEMDPPLFPYCEKAKWIHRTEYELPQVRLLQEKQEQRQEETEKFILELDAEIEKERLENSWMHHLLTGTDSQLVEAVIKALETLGFKHVIDVDKERDRENKSRREDLQIKEDNHPVLVIDVKGISGTPKDEDVIQANKHASLRTREWNDTSVRGLSIINHERHIPPLERNNIPFRKELLELATEEEFGLLTTWDIYRLVKNKTKNVWLPEYVKPLFYQQGRIEVLPQHYEPLGTITRVFPKAKAFGLDLQGNSLEIGDRIAIQFLIEFEEMKIESLRVNDVSVDKANPGDSVGISWSSEKPPLKEGLNVFKVKLNNK